MKLMEIYKQVISEQTYEVFHGGPNEFKKFDFKQSYQKLAWFTDDIETIKSGEAGAKSSKYIMQFKITIDNPAGWPEYKKYGIGQIKEQGFDGIILSSGGANNYIVFSPKQIKYIKTVKSPL